MFSHQALSQQSYQQKMIEQVLISVENYDFYQQSAVRIYYYNYRALQQPENEIFFQQLKKEIETHWQVFPMSEIRSIYLGAINYCIKRLNSGNRAYIREAFELYRSGLTNKVLFENGVLSAYTYKNTLIAGLQLGEETWVLQFLEVYKPFLDPKNQENIYHYNRAIYHFRLRQYDDAMQYLRDSDFKDVFFNLDARLMLLRIYYETDAWDALDAHLNTFSTFLYRQHSVAGLHKNNYLNLIKLMRQLLKSNLSDKNTRLKLQEKIKKSRELAEKAWLLEKVTG
ncbi:MAG: hypothetical protein RLZZ292_2602 [Bacteroidota bacterium]|jgi:hypothetical protein